jgi:hypothetical protein
MATINLPRAFFDDRIERELPMPQILRQTARHYVVKRDDPALADYLDDARYYARDVDAAPMSVILSARHTVKVMTA